MKRFLCVLFVVLLGFSTVSLANEEAVVMRADDFFSSYGTGLGRLGGGGISITFSTTAVQTMHTLGVHSYSVEQKINGSWTTIAPSIPGKLSANTISHSSTASYYGSSGGEYRIYTCFYAMKYDGSYKYVWKYSPSIVAN